MFTYQDYRRKVCTHDEFWQQYVNAYVLRIVRSYIGEQLIRESSDPHFNDIPLHQWDSLHPFIRSYVARKNVEFGVNDSPYVSMSDCTCTLKAAARKIKSEKED